MKEPNEFVWNGPHHLYLGAFMVFWGALMIVQNYGAFSYIFAGLGVIIFIDDMIEHTVTASTPLRLLFEKVLFPLVLKFNEMIKRNK